MLIVVKLFKIEILIAPVKMDSMIMVPIVLNATMKNVLPVKILPMNVYSPVKKAALYATPPAIASLSKMDSSKTPQETPKVNHYYYNYIIF